MDGKFLAVILIFVTNFRLCQGRTYVNYSLFSIVLTETDHLSFLQNLETQKYIDVVFWKKPHKLHEETQMIVSPADKSLFLERTRHFGIDVKLILVDVQAAFDAQKVHGYLRLHPDSYSWNDYHTLDAIYDWLGDVALKFPNIIELETIGKSAEGKDILAVCIKSPDAKEGVIVEGGIHGNEWIATEFVTFLMHQLVYANDSENNQLKEVANLYQWYLVPILNPDGYMYSHIKDRLWRKNKRIIDTGIGVDLNRNFDYNFGKHGTSNMTNDDVYCGPAPFSEPETRSFVSFISKKSQNLKFYFSIHAYGQKIIIPYADRIKHVDNYREMENYAKQAILKMYKLHGIKYSVGTTYDTMGLRISGNSASWAKKTHGIKYVFTFVLRDNGSYGFALPNDQIQPSCEEALVGMLEIMTAKPKHIRANEFGLSGEGKTGEELILSIILFWLLK